MLQQLISQYSQFKSKYVVSQRRQHEYFINRYYAHLIDPFFTKIAYDMKLSPNQVTTIAMLIGVLSGASFALGYLLTGALLLQLHHFLDGADGNLARLTNSCSEFGQRYDQFSDQFVRLVVFCGVAIHSEQSIIINMIFFVTLYFDLFIVHYYVLPKMQQVTIQRAPWKKWFLERGIIPALDIFTIYFIISICAIWNKLDIAIWIVIFGKNLDWMYRVYEVRKSSPSSLPS